MTSHIFILFRSLGLADDSGNIYEMLEYTFFDHSDLGYWEKMMQGMVNVSTFQKQGQKLSIRT